MKSARVSSWVIGGILVLAVLLTRTQHFGTAVSFPDASLAVLFLGGLWVARPAWLAVALVAIFGMDAYALGVQQVSDYCMSAGYWGLLPTYALVWWMGRKASVAGTDNTKAFVYGVMALSLAFVLSNAFWYGFSDKVAQLSVIEFASRVAQYYIPYVGFGLMYVLAGLGMQFALQRYQAQTANSITQ